ncbi:MAG: pilus assembly protein PilM [Candidatus Margulisiibacteriota bacterium]|jgi:type IV pilus assembly protein PilM
MPWNRAALGIDLRVSSVKVVEIEPKDSGFAIKNWGVTEVPIQLLDKHPQLEDAKADALRKLIHTHNIKTKEAFVVTGGDNSYIKLLPLAGISESELVEAIKWKFAQDLPFPIEEALVDYYSLPKEYYVAACINHKHYLDIQRIVNKAGLVLSGITVLPIALQELYQEELKKDPDKLVAIIYLGKRSTNISIFRKGRFEFNRELTVGGDAITLAMSGILVSPEGKVEISPEEAEKIKLEHGVPLTAENYPKVRDIPITQLQAMVRPALEKVLGEISRTLEYYKGQSGEASVDKIILTGGSSLTVNLREFLQTGLGIPVETPKFKTDFNPRLSAAIGAARNGKDKINLLPEEVKNRWKLITTKLLQPTVLVPAFIGVLAAVYFLFWSQAYMLRQEINAINSKLNLYKPRLAQFDLIERASAEEEKQRLMMTSFKEKRTQIPKVFEELSRLIPTSVTVNSINLTIGTVHLWGTAFKQNDSAENILSRFVLSLSSSPLFGDVQLVQAIKNYDYNVEAFNFEIVGIIKER